MAILVHYTWKVVMALGVVCAIVLGCTLCGLGVFMTPLVQTFGCTSTQAARAATLFIVAMTAVTPFVGAMISRWGARVVMSLGVLVASMGCILAAASPNMTAFTASLALAGIGVAASSYLPSAIVISHCMAGPRCAMALAGVFAQNYTGASSPYPIQAFSEEGYAVLRVNPRGSSGYGGDFRYANTNDWGYGDYDDIMGGVDKLIADGIAHTDSLCVTGWSYGGYMTSMIITKTNRFKAAMVGAGVTNLISFTGTADIPGFIPDYFGGEMWDRTDVYMKHSAMFGVKNVKTPTLLIHGERDLRVPLSQGQELYMALKRLGVKTKMVTYPRTPHGPQEPKFIQDIGERVIVWFNENCRKRNGKIGATSLGVK